MEIFDRVAEIVWGPYLIILLLGVGTFLSFRLLFIQIRHLFSGFFIALGFDSFKLDEHSERSKKGDIPPFQALFTALSATIGIGNIIGVAGAILIGGPGALFWMWVTAILGMATKYSEAVLAISYRESTPTGFAGGPMYYIEKGLKWRWMGIFFAVAVLFASLGIGNMVQANAAAGELYASDMNVPRGVTALIISLITGLVVIGGIKRIGRVASFLVPFMAISYFIGCFYILATNAEMVPKAFGIIFKYAFDPLPVVVGTAGGFLLICIRTGVQRGLFSNEAGLGSAPMADASARVDYAVKQGMVSMLGPFIDTIIICTLTGLTIIIGLESNGLEILYKSASSKPAHVMEKFIQLRQNIGVETNIWTAIVNHLGSDASYLKDVLTSFVFQNFLGTTGGQIVKYSIFFFAVTTIIGWFHYSDRAILYLWGGKYSSIYKVLWVSLTFWGAYTDDIVLIWKFSDIFNGLMAIPNLVALLLLSPQVVEYTKDFFQKFPHKHDLAVYFYLIILKILPKRILSKLFGYIAGWNAPKFVMVPILVTFAKIFKVNVQEAELELKNYKSLNNFFIRTLKNEARVIESEDKVIVSPVDGTILNFGRIKKGTIIQAKGIEFSLKDILGNHKYYERFLDGSWITLYLSPRDYHRIHYPVSGELVGYSYRPGRLFPVNRLAVNMIKKLFSKNERLITYVETEKGLTALIKIGATNVGKIKVNYDKILSTNNWVRSDKDHEYIEKIPVIKGEELGRFEMGSTVILLLEKNCGELLDFEEKQSILYGQPIGILK